MSHGGLALSRPLATAAIAVFIVGCILLLPQRAGTLPGQVETAFWAPSDLMLCVPEQPTITHAYLRASALLGALRERHAAP